MKKLFTIAAALLASVAMMASTTYSLIKNDTLNTEDFQTLGQTFAKDGSQTFEEVAYTQYFTFNGTSGAPAYDVTKTVIYHAKTTSTDIKIYAYNADSGTKAVYLTYFDEAAAAFVSETINIDKTKQAIISKSLESTTNRTFYLHTSSKKIQFYKVDVTEKGDALKQAGEVGYSLNFNKGRLCAAASTERAYTMEGMTFFGISSNYGPNNNSELQLKTIYADGVLTTLAYVSFTAKEACQLHIKDNNGKGYWVSKTLAEGVQDDLIINKDAKVDLTPGTWYVISSSKGAIKFNLIEFLAPDLTPVLNVDKESVNLKVTPATAEPSAKVKFTGRNLAAGTYNLVVPNLAGLTVAPTSVTVAEDGLLDAEVTISYTSAVDVAAASTNISLTIGELSKAVAVNYSAALAKVYLTKNVNIEQLVLDNGKGYDIKAALTAAGWEYENLDALDSLNDEKTARNEPYLGLKIKKQGGYVAGWLKTDGVLLVKFGAVKDPVKFTAKGATTDISVTQTAAELAGSDNVFAIYGFTEDVYVKIETTTDNTVVLKQLMLDEIAEVILPAKPEPTAIDNTEAEVKAVKAIENGQLVVIKNGVKYNVLGNVIR